MSIEYELTANKILNEIFNIILDDNLSDTEALEAIILVLKNYNVTIESVIGEQNR